MYCNTAEICALVLGCEYELGCVLLVKRLAAKCALVYGDSRLSVLNDEGLAVVGDLRVTVCCCLYVLYDTVLELECELCNCCIAVGSDCFLQ